MGCILRPLACGAVPVLCAALTAGCASSSPEPVDATLPGPPEWNRNVTPPSDDQASGDRESCVYRAGALPAETQGESRPNGKEIPIDHIVVMMMENRSFDHYFQAARSSGLDVDVAPEGFTNPDTEGTPVAPYHQDGRCFVDTAHDWESIRRQIDDGKMDGFVVTNEGNHEIPANGAPDAVKGSRAMAQNFAIGDRYFASAPTATWPNRMFLFSASSHGLRSNKFPEDVEATIFDHLNERKVSWTFYATVTPTLTILLDRFLELSQVEGRFAPIEQFYEDAAAGRLPEVAFLDADGTSSVDVLHSDEHPPAPATIGQNWIGKAIEALAGSPQWKRSAMFITYDEHGGLFDHVTPPPACPPDDRPLDETDRAIFGSHGIRVPFFVLSPFAKKGYVSHRTYDHTSILRFIEARFVVPALSHRDANAEAPWDAFDFTQAPGDAPSVPVPAVDEEIVAGCRAAFE
jgi:phospholipase C